MLVQIVASGDLQNPGVEVEVQLVDCMAEACIGSYRYWPSYTWHILSAGQHIIPAKVLAELCIVHGRSHGDACHVV